MPMNEHILIEKVNSRYKIIAHGDLDELKQTYNDYKTLIDNVSGNSSELKLVGLDKDNINDLLNGSDHAQVRLGELFLSNNTEMY